jgi:hypothetical protein
MAWTLTEYGKVRNAFSNQQGDVVTLTPTVTNDALVCAVVGVKHPSPFNLQQDSANPYTALDEQTPDPVITDNKGNTWTRRAYVRLTDVAISSLSGFISKWGMDGFFPSVYLYTCVPTTGTTTVNVNSMYPEDFTHGDKVTGATGGYYSPSEPVFNNGVNVVVGHFNKGAGVTNTVVGSSGVSTANPAGSDLGGLTGAGAGALIVSLGLMKDSNAFGPGSNKVGGTALTEFNSEMVVGDCSAYFALEYGLASGSSDKPNWSDPLGYEMTIASVSVA